jgi:hypothetical protein
MFHMTLKTEKNYYFVTPLLTHSMEQSPSSEENRFSASREFPRILWNREVFFTTFTKARDLSLS